MPEARPCRGTTRNGSPCQNETTKPSGLCGQCKGLTKGSSDNVTQDINPDDLTMDGEDSTLPSMFPWRDHEDGQKVQLSENPDTSMTVEIEVRPAGELWAVLLQIAKHGQQFHEEQLGHYDTLIEAKQEVEQATTNVRFRMVLEEAGETGE